MRLHTSLTWLEVHNALQRAKDAGKVTEDVQFLGYDRHNSRSHERAFEIQLGTYDKTSLPPGTKDQYGKNMKTRRYKNSGDSGAESGWFEPAVYAATWHEWGWFMREVFDADPGALFGSVKGHGYNGTADFHEKTNGAFK